MELKSVCSACYSEEEVRSEELSIANLAHLDKAKGSEIIDYSKVPGKLQGLQGLNKFIKDIEMMIGRKHWLFWMWWRVCWLIVTPGFLTTILIWSIIITDPPTYGNIEYPTWQHFTLFGFADSVIIRDYIDEKGAPLS
ncbi:hypothetical protein scyTo_0004335 [Scyliorhinus torazame]|uniref:Uncharacterized protein n=1 Tax=Scyliorhinus torazame TaxID=75743 RepID=A0A401NQ23_SCYTO|nr:hypothetical protein [Scyliorhinus torazame]